METYFEMEGVYYKERKLLKTFLIQFVPTLPLMSDPPVRL
jgi:hypothetical protein